SRRGRGDDGERENGLGDGAGGGSAPRRDSGVDGGREGRSAQLAARVSELFGGAFLAVGRVGRLAAGSAAARRSGPVARGGAASGAPQLGGGGARARRVPRAHGAAGDHAGRIGGEAAAHLERARAALGAVAA